MDVHDHLRIASLRAQVARDEARRLLEACFPGPSLVWSVRAAEILMREFVLAPHFLLEGDDWVTAMTKAGALLENAGQRGWRKAFASAEEWWGPFDRPLTENDQDAWEYWKEHIVSDRGDIVHGRFTGPDEVSTEAARTVLEFSERMHTWYSQRLALSGTHPLSGTLRQALEAMRDAVAKPAPTRPDEDPSSAPG